MRCGIVRPFLRGGWHGGLRASLRGGLRGELACPACAEALRADWYPLWEMDTNRRVAWMDEVSFVSSFVFGYGTDHLRCENVHFRIHFLNWIRNLPYICMKAPIPYPFSKLDTKMDIQGRFEAISVSTFKNGYENARAQRAPGKKRTPIRTEGRRGAAQEAERNTWHDG